MQHGIQLSHDVGKIGIPSRKLAFGAQTYPSYVLESEEKFGVFHFIFLLLNVYLRTLNTSGV
jgi:hypothetical protein